MFISRYKGPVASTVYEVLVTHKSLTYLIWAVSAAALLVALLLAIPLWLKIAVGLVSVVGWIIGWYFPRSGTGLFGKIFIPLSWVDDDWGTAVTIYHEAQHLDDQQDMGTGVFLGKWLSPKGCAYLEARAYYYNIIAWMDKGRDRDYFVEYYRNTLKRGLPYFQVWLGSKLGVDVDTAFMEGLRSRGLDV